MSNFKNYLSKIKGHKINIDITSFINENFINYLKKITVINEDIDYYIDIDGNVTLTLDLIKKTKGKDKLESVKTIQNLFDHIKEFSGVENFLCNKEEIDDIEKFVKFIKDKSEIKELSKSDNLSILSHYGPVFKITATTINIEKHLEHSINYFIRNKTVSETVKEKINILNQIITNSFNSFNSFNKLYFVLTGSKEEKKPVILNKEIHENGLRNLIMCCFIDKTQRKLLITTLTTMAEQILEAEKQQDINKTESIGQKITTATNQYIKTIEKMPDDFKGKIEVQFYPKPAKLLTGK